MNEEQIKKVCRRIIAEMMEQDRAISAVEDCGISLPPEITVDLMNTVWYMCGIPFDTWSEETNKGLCLDWLLDRYVELCDSDGDSNEAAAQYIDFLFEGRDWLYEKGLEPRTEIDEADAQNAQFRRTDGE